MCLSFFIVMYNSGENELQRFIFMFFFSSGANTHFMTQALGVMIFFLTLLSIFISINTACMNN